MGGATAPAGAPLVRSDLATFTLAPDSEVVVTLWLETRAAGHAGSGAVDVRWAPEALAFEGVELPSGGVDPVVNADAQVAGLLRFAFADVAGFEGRVPLVRLRFHTAAASAAAAAGAWALALEVRELSAADAAFTPLGARATGVVQPLVVRR